MRRHPRWLAASSLSSCSGCKHCDRDTGTSLTTRCEPSQGLLAGVARHTLVARGGHLSRIRRHVRPNYCRQTTRHRHRTLSALAGCGPRKDFGVRNWFQRSEDSCDRRPRVSPDRRCDRPVRGLRRRGRLSRWSVWRARSLRALRTAVPWPRGPPGFPARPVSRCRSGSHSGHRPLGSDGSAGRRSVPSESLQDSRSLMRSRS